MRPPHAYTARPGAFLRKAVGHKVPHAFSPTGRTAGAGLACSYTRSSFPPQGQR